LLVARFAPDSIAQFFAAARVRDVDAQQLALAGRGTAAIYLWGYAAEMTLKGAWFALIGFAEDQVISSADLGSAEKQANGYLIQWPKAGRWHAIFAWAQLLTQHRITLRGAYPDPQFPAAVMHHSQRIYQRWRETMRYKKNRAYDHEVRAVAESVAWLLAHDLDA
jgi:hypothetical protein